MANVAFKKWERETGLAAVGNPFRSVDIKHNKKKFGVIYAPNWRTKHNKWTIAIAVKSEDDKSGWRWAFFKEMHENEEDARAWIKNSFKELNQKYVIHYFDY